MKLFGSLAGVKNHVSLFVFILCELKETSFLYSPALNKKRKTLHYLNVTVHPYQDCHVNNPIESVQLCLDTSSGRFICSGDAGAPIVLDRGDSRILVGLANRPQRCISEEPQIALRISSYLDWITDNLL